MPRLLYGFPVPDDCEHGLDLLQDSIESWGLPRDEEGIQLTVDWLNHVSRHSYFSTALMVPFTFKEQPGILMALSNGDSTTRMRENHAQYEEGAVITEPHWLLYDLWWYPGMALLNFAGIRQSAYQGHSLGKNLGELLQEVLPAKGMPQWRQRYCIIHHGYYLESLRKLLREAFHVYNWVELTSGYSYREFRALDLYVRVVSQGMQPPAEEAWYLLNVSGPPLKRWVPSPEDWWRYADLRSIGQRPCIAEWVLELTGVLATPQTQRRINVLQQHLLGRL